MYKQRYAGILAAAVVLAAGATSYGFRSEEPIDERLTAPAASSGAQAPQAMKGRVSAAAAMRDLIVEWDRSRGVPSIVTAPNLAGGSRAAGGAKGLRFAGKGDLQQDSLAVMDALAGVYGIRDAAAELKPAGVETSVTGFKHVRLQQRYGGLPVVGGQLIVHYDAQGVPRSVNGLYHPDIKVSPKPTVTPEAAAATAQQDLQAGGKPGGQVAAGPELAVLVRNGTSALVYQLTITYPGSGGMAGRWRYYVNAHTGAVQWRYNDVPAIAAPTAGGAHVPITGSVLTGEGGGVATVTGWRETAGPFYYLWNKTNTWYIFNAGRGSDANTYAYRTTDDWGTSDRVEMSAGTGFEAVETYFRTVHGRRSFDDANAMARANVHYGNNYVNAYWNGVDFTFGDGDGFYANELTVLDVAGHEFQHAVTENSANLVYMDESGALNESMSDIFGALIEFNAQPDGRSVYPDRIAGASDWLMGEDCWLVSTALRDMRNPANPATVGAGNEQPTRYKGTYWYSGSGDNGGVHYNSGVQNFFFYLLCEGGNGINDGIAYAVLPVGIPAGRELAYLTVTRYMTPETDYTAARAAWIGAAVELDASGRTTNTVLAAMQAWAAVGIGSAEMIMPTEPYIISGETNAPPYVPTNKLYMVVNATSTAMTWTVSCTAPWLSVSPTAFTVEPGTYSNVIATVDQALAAGFPEGVYGDLITFTTTIGDQTTNYTRQVALRIGRNYKMQSAPYAWVDPREAPGYSILDLSAGVSGAYPIPFPFRLYGTPYTHVYVSPFGMAGFVNAALNTSENADLPTTAAPRAFVAPYWDDLESRRIPALVIAGVMGVEPNRRLVLSWLDSSHAEDREARFSFQVVIPEAAVAGENNDILFQYKEVSEQNLAVGCGRSATIGIEDELGALNRKYSYNGATWVANGQAILFTQTPIVNANVPVGTVRALGAVGSNVTFEVRFSEVVTGFDVADLVLGGSAGGTIGAVTGGGMLYRVEVTGVAGYGSVTLAVVDNAVVNEVGTPNVAFGPALFVMPCSGINAEDNMEFGTGTWTPSVQQPVQLVTAGWQWGTPSYEFGPLGTPSGSKCWGTIIDGPYSNNMNATLESAPIAVGENPVLEFNAWYDLEIWLDYYYFDFGYVEVNDGSGWINVTPGGFYGGYSGGWLPQQIYLDNDLFGNRTIKVRFRATSDGSVTKAGMYVDDLKVSSQRQPGVWVVGYAPTNGAPSTTVPVAFTIYNSSTQTINAVIGTVGCPNSGVSITGSSSVAYGNLAPGALVTGAPVSLVLGAAGNFDASTLQLFHTLAAADAFSTEEVLPFAVEGVTIIPATNLVTVRASMGVTNWLGKALAGDGTPASCMFQVIGAGADGLIDPPGLGGGVTDDDRLLFSSAGGLPFGRFGEGSGVSPDFGRFLKAFGHALPAGSLIYVRAWDAAAPDSSVAYGDSSTYALNALANQTNDFRGWGVATPWLPYRDSNGDSIPDGYCVLNGMDPRSPVVGLTPAWRAEATLNGASTASGKFAASSPARVFYRGAFLFALDTGNGRIQVWNRFTRAYVGSYGSGGNTPGKFSQPLGLALDPRAATNRFAVADTQNHRIQVFGFDPATGTNITFQFQFGTMGSGSAQFRNPNGIAFGADGSIFVADTGNGVDAGNSRIQRFSGTGTYLATIASSGTNAGQVNMPRGLCVGPDGSVVVADTGNHRIQAFSLAGTPLWSIGSYGTNALQFWSPRGVQAGVGGRLYVADTQNSRIQVLSSNGMAIATFRATGATPSETLHWPYDLMPAMDTNLVYVADTLNSRIAVITTVFDRDGDGMDDVWEDLHGLDSSDPSDALLDYDGDGTINIGEYRVQQDPGLPPVRITGFNWNPVTVEWDRAVTGGVYQFEYATGPLGLVLPNWVPGPVVTTYAAGAASWTSLETLTNEVEFVRIRHLNP